MYSPSHLEVAILNYLNENDITVPIKGVLQEAMYDNDDQISSYSMSAVYKALSNLVSRNIVALGMRYGRSLILVTLLKWAGCSITANYRMDLL